MIDFVQVHKEIEDRFLETKEGLQEVYEKLSDKEKRVKYAIIIHSGVVNKFFAEIPLKEIRNDWFCIEDNNVVYYYELHTRLERFKLVYSLTEK